MVLAGTVWLPDFAGADNRFLARRKPSGGRTSPIGYAAGRAAERRLAACGHTGIRTPHPPEGEGGTYSFRTIKRGLPCR